MNLLISYHLFVGVGVVGSIAATASLTEAAPVRNATATTTPQQEEAAPAVTEKSSDPSPSRIAVPSTTNRPSLRPTSSNPEPPTTDLSSWFPTYSPTNDQSDYDYYYSTFGPTETLFPTSTLYPTRDWSSDYWIVAEEEEDDATSLQPTSSNPDEPTYLPTLFPTFGPTETLFPISWDDDHDVITPSSSSSVCSSCAQLRIEIKTGQEDDKQWYLQSTKTGKMLALSTKQYLPNSLNYEPSLNSYFCLQPGETYTFEVFDSSVGGVSQGNMNEYVLLGLGHNLVAGIVGNWEGGYQSTTFTACPKANNDTTDPTADQFDYDYYYDEDDDDGLDGDYYYTEGENVYAEVPSKPTHRPSKSPTKQPTKSPTKTPTRKPSRSPTQRPTNRPSFKPSEHPSPRPSPLPTNKNVDAEVGATDVDATTGSSKSKKSAKSGKKTSRKL